MILSIIVPVYNVEQHLQRCLESIACQMHAGYELVLVDDGSTDHSAALCDAFAQQHPELAVVVVHQPNAGLSAARNRGLEVARGEYVTFIDSDDHIDAHTLEPNVAFLVAHPEVDMVEYPIEVHAQSPAAHVLTFADATVSGDVFAHWVLHAGYKHCYACNKIYRSTLWCDVRFPLGEYFEDVSIMPHIIRRLRSVHYSSHGCYRYVMHAGSITTSYRYGKQKALFEGNHRLYSSIKEIPELRTAALHLWVCCLNQLIDMGRCADADRVAHAHLVKEFGQHRPSCVQLLKANAGVAIRLKLLPLLVLSLPTYCRLYVAFTKPLVP